MQPLTRNPNLTPPPSQKRQEPNEIQLGFGDRWWTGRHPAACSGFDPSTKTLHAIPILNFETCSRQDAIDAFDNSWTLTEVLFSGLKTPRAFTLPPYHQLRHPLIFYYGHPAVLLINKLRVAGLVAGPVDPYLENILEVGVDEMSWDDLSKNTMEWPRVEEIHAYRAKIYKLAMEILKNHPDLDQPRVRSLGESHPLWALWMSMEHEKIHLETSSVLMRELPLELLEKPKYWPDLHPSARDAANVTTPQEEKDFPRNVWRQSDGGLVKFGKSRDVPFYGWDNEYGHREFSLREFHYTQQLISNGEFYEFVRSGDYVRDEYWTTEGQSWRKFRNIKRPTFWTATGPEGLHAYSLRTIFDLVPMPWSWPVEVNFHEAKAYCNWRSRKDQAPSRYRLLSENEFQWLQQDRYRSIPQTPMPENFNSSRKENLNLRWGGASPVDAEIAGNVWQWMEDAFNPLAGFRTHPFYDDFSTPCFDGLHRMILGGSFISCGQEAVPYARFHFRPHFFQHSGFRMAYCENPQWDNGVIQSLAAAENSASQSATPGTSLQSPDWWKNFHQPLQASPEQWDRSLREATEAIFRFVADFPKRAPGGVSARPSGELSKIARSVHSSEFPQSPTELSKLLNDLFQDRAEDTQWPGHPRYSAYLAGSTNLISAVAQLVAAVLNPYTAHYEFAPHFVELEAESLRWFTNLFGLPLDTALGFYTTGGSFANLSALWAASQKKRDGSDLSKFRFYASEQSHHCLRKNLAFLGYPSSALVSVPVGLDLKIRVKDLETLIEKDLNAGFKPIAIIGTAGTTNSGSVDDLRALADVAERHHVWFHVDGAYGALFQMTSAGRELLSGIERVDSLVFDPHKTLSLPYGTGAVLFRNRSDMLIQYGGPSSYMPKKNEFDDGGLRVDYAHVTPELSREFRGLRVWLPLKVLGVTPFILNLEEKLQLTRWLYDELGAFGELELGPRPELSVLLFRWKGDDIALANRRTELLLEKINASGILFLSSCLIQDKKFIRVATISHQQHFSEIENFVKKMRMLVGEVREAR